MRRRDRQRGAALLLFAVVLVIAFCAVVFRGLGKWATATTTSRNVNAEVLAQAKTALIGYVAKEVLDLSENVPGRFPCPESPGDAGTDNEGRASSVCAPTYPSNKNVGRLPWRTLGVDKLVDASGEPLWYAVSPNWVTTAGAPPPPPTVPPFINAGTPGQLSFDGIGDVVAVIIAPGKLLSTNPAAAQIAAGCIPAGTIGNPQKRSDRSHVPASGADPDYRDYLECQNATSPIDTAFGVAIVDNATKEVTNDQAVVITAKDVLNALQGPLAERLQRTVAPLLSEYSGLWPVGLWPGGFMPYAVAFATPESKFPIAQHCGPSATTPQQPEGLLPLAPNAGTCISTWGNFAISGSVTSLGCTTVAPSNNVQCSFQYYRLSALGAALYGGGATSTDVTIQATAPHAAASFRQPLKPSDVIVPAGLVVQAATLTPQTDGDARLSLQIRVTGTQLCDNSLLGVVCNLLSVLYVTSTQVAVEFPQLPSSITLQGSKLSTAAKNGRSSFDFLAPIAGDPHYWFMKNEWYRYTYYAVSPSASAAHSAGDITVSGFPTAFGSPGDKRFVLALMGPPVTGQVRDGTVDISRYVEGQNAVTSGSPRTFAYTVYTASPPGNDRLATCPFTSGVSLCD